ncbi:hypothetical protein VINI7043_09684 [Vibrio nigripulchritudo ATCC 27043]|uniref:CAP domain-containing protein n=1 Tax=Vibrio nigripulchritudo TaxID=28173 RepID=UPI00021C26CF|nr:CAP domain-containing protein [Vibrio nigripulchritudo]EGU56271.1 hypothetical protein VINI7043_09684 [Vibrio nigripulchritudo ATCC 27043]
MLSTLKSGTLTVMAMAFLAGCGGESTNGASQTGGQIPPVTKPTDPTLPPVDQTEFAKEMLAAINHFRSSPQTCGGIKMPAVEPLTWSSELEMAAQIHSSNMANYNFFDHTGLDGKEPENRANDAGYPGGFIGENISAGRINIHDVMAGWMSSKGHCENIMGAGYKDVGAAMVENSDATYRFYWTQVFGARR